MARLVREQWTFGILSGAEKAQIGWYWLSPSSEDVAALAAAADAAMDDLWDVLRTTYNGQTAVTQRDYIETDVSTGAVESVTPGLLPTSPAGSASAPSMPGQISEVLSIRTLVPGASGRGRFYLPGWESGGFTTAGQLSIEYRTAVVNAFKAFFEAVEDDTTYQLGVYSRKDHAWLDATSIDMGSVPDTQRRRRNKLVEARYSVLLT